MKFAGALVVATAFGYALAHYRDVYSVRNAIDTNSREDNLPNKAIEYVECPVCEISPWLDDGCTAIGRRGVKECRFGTYVNEVCGNRLDCYRGPNETCTEKQERDMHGKRCMIGTYCIKSTGRCSDPNALDLNQQWGMNALTNNHQYKLVDSRYSRDRLAFPNYSPWETRGLY